MVRRVRAKESPRSVAKRFGVSLSHVQRWVQRAAGVRLDRVDWSDRPPGCGVPTNRAKPRTEKLVLTLRRELKDKSSLGEYGAAAIRAEMLERGHVPVPCTRTIGRILARRGAIDGRGRRRHPPPPRGWYLPRLAAGKAELDSFDIVDTLPIKGHGTVEVLNGISMLGGLVGSWPLRRITSKDAVLAILEHWRAHGLPVYAQFDNDTIFQGAHQFADNMGRVIRLCLALSVTPVFAPPQENGFQASIESYNGLWQKKVYARFHHRSLEDLQRRSNDYIAARRHRDTDRIDAVARRAVPKGFVLDLQARLRGTVIYLRRASLGGVVSVLGHQYDAGIDWGHKLIRAEVDLDRGRLRLFGLRRKDPTRQPKLISVPYQMPHKRFNE